MQNYKINGNGLTDTNEKKEIENNRSGSNDNFNTQNGNNQCTLILSSLLY